MRSYVTENENSDNTRYNPGNLRWKYMLETMQDKEKQNENEQLVKQIAECLNSLAKFPLVLEEVTHCAILNGFDANIINKMKELGSSKEHEKEENWRPIKNLENWNLSPISKKANGKL